VLVDSLMHVNVQIHFFATLLDDVAKRLGVPLGVRKTPLSAPFIYKNDHFTKTGSGQT
jgi:hypothetical protein